ncbi:MAG TPA: anthranilate synthase component I [Terriglobales bacterium]|nr:anthranilate synthase component I [Terriglobales bacterium]
MKRHQKWGIVFGQAAQQSTSQTEHRIKLQKFRYSTNPLNLFGALSSQSDHCYLLESAEGPRKLAQYSFIGFSPGKVIKVKKNKYSEFSSSKQTTTETDEPFAGLRNALTENYTTYHGFRFVGGLVGYFSYDAVRYLEALPTHAEDDLELPDLEFGVYDDGIVFDHLTGQAYYYWYTRNRLREIERLLEEKKTRTRELIASDLAINIPQSRFEGMVRKAKNYIKAGDIFQTVLSKRFECSFEGDLLNFYKTLREINPSPYMYFLKMRKRAIVGSSPEMLGRVDKRDVETFPIAGTRPIGKTRREDEALATELLEDPKERAEHVMLTDLARNDLGKVCEFGSIHVPEFMAVQKYSHVQHIVSRVSGKLNPDRDAIDVFKAIFPAGTVSGAPKKRAMEIIEELEPYRRGAYAGAIGYFSYNGNADFAITIRTLIANGNRAYIQAGAGIVADSVPRREWFETERKAEALLHALKTRSS